MMTKAGLGSASFWAMLSGRNDDMKKEYDFSKGVRGKFYRQNARFNMPIYLDSQVQRFVEQIAENKRTDVSAVVNRLLRSGMELVEAAK